MSNKMSDEKDAPLGRREFFRRGVVKAAEIVVDAAEVRAEASSRQWIRPPFALSELDFLIECTRCGDCAEVCPTGLIFPLPARYGATAISTPALDLVNKACLMCSDWPCVAACEPGALKLPMLSPVPPTTGEKGSGGEEESPDNIDIPPPRLARAAIDASRCLPHLGPECGACSSSCPVPGALLWDGPKPHIDSAVCTGCGACRVACITEPKSVLISPCSQGTTTSR